MSGWDTWNDPGKILAAATGKPAPIGEYSVSTSDTAAHTLSALIASAVSATTFAANSPSTLALAIAAGATFARICVETNDVRVSYFGNTSSGATIGELCPKGATYSINSDLTQVVIAAQSAAATLRISLFA